MQIIGTKVHEEMGGKQGYTVEFVGDGGEVVSVQLRPGASSDLNRMNALEKARVLLLHAANYEGDEGGSPKAMDAAISARRAHDQAELEDQLEEGLEDTFPASDPVSAVQTTTAGSDRKH